MPVLSPECFLKMKDLREIVHKRVLDYRSSELRRSILLQWEYRLYTTLINLFEV
jgi:hypothetical protein